MTTEKKEQKLSVSNNLGRSQKHRNKPEDLPPNQFLSKTSGIKFLRDPISRSLIPINHMSVMKALLTLRGCKNTLLTLFLFFKIITIKSLFVVICATIPFLFSLSGKCAEKRIISLAPSLTQSLYYLGAQDQLVGCTSYCMAAKKEHKEIVASAIKANLEKIASLKPDLVIVSGFTTEKELSTLRKLNIKVEVFHTPSTFEAICTQFEKLGSLTGKEDKAKAIILLAKQKADSIKSQFVNIKNKPRIFIQIGASPIFSVLPNTFMDDYITYCGGVNMASDLKKGTIGRELVIARNPDYIFIATMGIVGENEKKSWNQFTQLKAVKNKHIYLIDSDMACEPTPLRFIETLEIISNAVQSK